jgi:hypothetical protein
MKAEDIISLISLIVAIIGGIFAIIQWQKSNKIRQAEFINQIITKITSDKNIAETIYMIDNENIWFDDKFGNGSEIEVKIDTLFSFLTYICYLYDTKNIRDNEFRIFEYEIRRVCSDKQSQAYLWNLYHWSKQHLKARCSFQNLVEYLQNKVLSAEDRKKFDSTDDSVSGYTKLMDF